PPDAPQERAKVLAIDVLHREKDQTVSFADVVNAADVRMGNSARNANFIVKSFERDRILCSSFGQELQCNRLLETQVVGAIDLAHTSTAEERDDSITLGKNGSRNEAALIRSAARSR